VCRQLREFPAERYQYVLLLTAKDTTADIVAGLEAGADDYLTKPFDAPRTTGTSARGRSHDQATGQFAGGAEALRFQATHDR